MTTDQNARSGSDAGQRSPRTARTSRGAGHQAASFLKELVFVVVGALIVSSLLRAFVGQMFIIPSQSMESTLLIGDRVVVEKLTGFQRGDVVVFEDPGHWLENEPVVDPGPFDRVLEFVGIPTASTPGHLIKRVIGLPGDRVVCCDDQSRITVNGHQLDETSYLYVNPDGSQVNASDVRFRVVVPKDRIFVMGDHRDLSADSRCHLADVATDQPRGAVAFVPENLVVGPAFAIAAPFSRAHRLKRPATFDGVPAPKRAAPDQATIEPPGITC
ncbi:MAG: signal peptidase I [Friedmanniella sp.]